MSKGNNLIPFDLEAALRNEPILYRDGKPAKFIAHVPEAKERHSILTMNDDGDILGHYPNGKHYSGLEKRDLFMAPKPVEGFANVYPESFSSNYESLDAAVLGHRCRATSVCKITILNGEVIAHETVHRYQ